MYFNASNNNFHEIYLDVLEKHLNNYDYCNSPRGQQQRECLLTSFTLTNPIERVCYSIERNCNIIFQFAEVLWYLKGSNSLDFISYYAPSISKYSNDFKTLDGTAYGKNIFLFDGCINQWDFVKKELQKDKDTKRAVITIRNPKETIIENNVDMSCTLSLQFLNRENKLHLITTMRANDAFRGEASDVFSFTFLQELLANELGLDLGYYYHQAASTQLYNCDYLKATRVIENRRNFDTYQLKFPSMPRCDNWDFISEVLSYEESLRHNVPLSQLSDSHNALPPYWHDIIVMFELYRQKKYNEKINAHLISGLHPTLKFFLENYLRMPRDEQYVVG